MPKGLGSSNPLVFAILRDRTGAITQPLILVIFTRSIPLFVNPIFLAAAGERSIFLPGVTGPRSFILTSTERPFCVLVTRTMDPSGKVFDAAEKPFGSNVSPLAVRRPS